MNPKPIYRPLFLEAWKTVWRHKRLWLVGIFAAVMASGGLFESVSGSWQTALRGRLLIEQCLNGTLPGYQWLVSYGRYMSALPPAHQYGLAITVLLCLVLLVVIGAIAQGALFAGALEKHLSNFRELFKMGSQFFWRVLWLDVLGKLGLGLVFMITVAPVAFMNPLPYGWHKYPPFISLVLFLVGAIFITVIQMLSLAGVIRKHLNVHAALAEAWDIFRLHVWVLFELGILLFIVSFLAALATLAALFVLGLPITLLFVAAIILGSPLFYEFSIIISIAVVVSVVLLASGLLTAFQYTVWSLFFEEAGRFGIIAKVKRWFML